MKETKMLTRRGFLRVTGGAVAPAGLLMGRVLGRANSTAPGDRLGVAVLGLGDRNGHLGRLHPIIFVLEYGEGRLFHSVMGHDGRAYTHHPVVGELIRRGCAWAAGLEPVEK